MDEIKTRLIESTDPDIQRALLEGISGEEIFVKNLETVQGSERDVILFSVAFSANEKGMLPLNFGPLNNEGGHRRLNVAITRARKQVRIFCSFLPQTLLNRNSGALGVQHLAEYLKLAFEGASSRAETFVVREEKLNRLRRKVMEGLLKAGLPVVESVGFSDFKVDLALLNPKDRNHAVLGILLDGPNWNSRETVTDRDVLPANLLIDKMGWNGISRIWTPDWLFNQEAVIESIREDYRNAISQNRSEKIDVAPEDIEKSPFLSSSPASLADPLTSLLERTPVWEPLSISRTALTPEHLKNIGNLEVQKVLSLIVDKLTEQEGPVSRDRFIQVVRLAFNVERLSADRVGELDRIPFPGHHRDSENFIYPKGLEPSALRTWRRGSESDNRSVSNVSLFEISVAIVDITNASEAIKPDELIRTLAAVLGFSRLTETLIQRFTEALELALRRGSVLKIRDYIRPA
jgi:hypothetical protein